MRPTSLFALLAALSSLVSLFVAAEAPPQEQPANTWVKRSPRTGGPPSPGLGYEAALAYDPGARRVIRWAGHNQGGGGEQNAETWALDPATMKWELMQPNRSPPGACCAQQDVFDVPGGRFLRFPAFSGQHGWHWFRENYLNNTSVWSFDLARNTWRDLRPAPTPHPAPLRGAAWDTHHQVAVIFGGEGSRDGTLAYDPYTNTWTRLRPPSEPAPRSGGNLAYDAAQRLHILFGSQFDDDRHTWGYDLARNTWRDLKPAVQPPTDRNDAVLAYDPTSRRVIAVVRVIDRSAGKEVRAGHLETWAYDADANTWTALKPTREPDSWGNRRRVMVAMPDRGELLLEAYINPTERVPGVEREQQIWTYRSAPAPAEKAPRPPARLTVRTAPGRADLDWEPSPSPGVKTYTIHRGAGARPWEADFKMIATAPAGRTRWSDEKLRAGTTYHYFVRAVGSDGRASDDSPHARTQPRIVEDAVASVRSAQEVHLRWQAPRGEEPIGYHVERAAVEVFSDDEVLRLKKDTPPLAEPSVGALRVIGPFVRLTRRPIKAREYTDTAVDLTRPRPIEGAPIFRHRFRSDQLDAKGKPYRFAVFAYRIRAVNALGVESGPSPYVLTIPSAPEALFAREDGGRCHLKWAANPERGLKGYRVYRMEGPRRNGPGQKVTRRTADPITMPRWTDPAATQETKRYWVVAVDALGQEGLPSAPAWHSRQYRKYYEPFVGPWHQ